MQSTDTAERQTPNKEASLPLILRNEGVAQHSGYLP